MGAWGLGPFDNDSASDWSSDLDDADDVTVFIRQTCQGDADGYVDGSEVVAAAAWLVSALPGGRPVDPVYGPKRAAPQMTPELTTLVAPALERVLGKDSEWRQQWDETGETEPVQLAEADLVALRAVS